MKRIAASGVIGVVGAAKIAIEWTAILSSIHAGLPNLLKFLVGLVNMNNLLFLAILGIALVAIWTVPWDRLKSYWQKPVVKQESITEGNNRRGKLFDLDVAIRASGDTPDRIPEWPTIRHWLRKRFGDDLTDEQLWERFRGWIEAEKEMHPNTWLVMSYDDAIKILK
jgi:hypothetical protein